MTVPALSVSSQSPADLDVDVLVMGVQKTESGPKLLSDDPHFEELAGSLVSIGITGGQDEVRRLPASSGVAARSIALVGVGATLGTNELRYAAGSATRQIRGTVSLGLAQRIHFTGFISDADVYGFLAASELVVHPALEEDFGLIVAEAQALARPVLAFASVGPAAIIADGQTGRLVPVGDERRLAAALTEMLAQPADLRRWGEAGRERSVRLFGAPACTRQLERIYAACLRTQP